jgi:hypothetical protein
LGGSREKDTPEARIFYKEDMELLEKKMNVYNLITPSDPITFLAPNDQVAFMAAIIVGEGAAGCNRLADNGNIARKLPTLMLFASKEDTQKIITDELGCGLGDFLQGDNEVAVALALESFAYGEFSDRKQFDAAVAAITDPAKLEEFKKTHDDLKRSSMIQWCNDAWDFAKRIRAKIERAEKEWAA